MSNNRTCFIQSFFRVKFTHFVVYTSSIELYKREYGIEYKEIVFYKTCLDLLIYFMSKHIWQFKNSFLSFYES